MSSASTEYTVSTYDSEGNAIDLTGTMEELQAQLAAHGYGGEGLRVTDEAGFTRGWVSATAWSAA